MKISYGETSIGISSVAARPEDFLSPNFGRLWDKLVLQMERNKYHKIDLDIHGGAVEDYLDRFRTVPGRALCPFCGKRPTSPDLDGSSIIGEPGSSCRICRDHVLLGTYLVRKARLAVTTIDAPITGDSTRLLEPIFDHYQVAFLDKGLKEMARTGHLLKFWDVFIDPKGEVAKDVTVKFINGYVPVCTEESLKDPRLLAGKKSQKKRKRLVDPKNKDVPKTFEHIASMALVPDIEGDGFSGVEALGVLKADVDHLGLLMSCGLPAERFTLSRLATFSRQMDWFFALLSSL